ncbi:hypothetical protein J4377_11705 [Halomonas sp. XH26]|uniref:hypothetical protein n=1 Tax=Halomonas sp. XH26 TaxID=2557993 RepID=UPI0020A199C6|nr:hypothetical protein [Halomonas sp. XH26]UTA78631.1 hypothetical protein J4377_11705 [Halomonas sp. XH26]
MKKITLHMGLWKTGTTFLQKKIFKGDEYAGMHISPRELELSFHQAFMNASPMWWKTEKGVELVESLFLEKSLYSAENLYRAKIFKQNMDRGVSGVEPFSFSHHIKVISDLLGNYDMELQVVFFFRRQPEWMASMYSEMSKVLKNPCQKDFENRMDLMIDRPWMYGDHVLKYDILYESLSDALGERRVMALPYEKLMSNENVLLFRQFTGIETFGSEPENSARVNKKSTGSDSWSLWDNESEKHVPGKLTLTEALRRKIFDHYLVSNISFQEVVACDLKELGYIQ